MKTHVYFLWYLSQFFLEWEKYQKKVTEKIKTHFLDSINFVFENRAVYEIIWTDIVQLDRSHTAIWHGYAFHAGLIRLQTHTLGIYVNHIAFDGNNGFQNAPPYDVYKYIASLVTFHVLTFNSYFRIIRHRRNLLKFPYEMFCGLLKEIIKIKMSPGVCSYLHYSFTGKKESTVNTPLL